MKAGMKEIARRADVRLPTVSYVLNDKWQEKRISKEVRDTVLRIAKELDYHPHTLARGLATRRTRNIGMAVRSMEYLRQTYFGSIMQGIAHQAGLHNYNIQFQVTDPTGESAKNLYFLTKVKERSVDGVVIIDQAVPDSEIVRLKQMNIPFVLVDRYLSGEDACSVRVDNRKGCYVATENLIKDGHRRVAFINDAVGWRKTVDMFDGYCQALGDSGIPVSKEMLVEINDLDVGREARKIERIFRAEPPATAIVCTCDISAVFFLRILREMEIGVPQDVALVGYNDDPSFAHIEPALTTVHVPLVEMGEESARLLLRMIDGELPEKSEIVFEPSLVVRQSTRGWVPER